jgi:tetratricopeptide (TPR) repeat protein
MKQLDRSKSLRRIGFCLVALLIAASAGGCPRNGVNEPGPGGSKADGGEAKSDPEAPLPENLDELIAFAKKRAGAIDEPKKLKRAVEALREAIKKAPERVDLLVMGVTAACRVGQLAKSHAVAGEYGAMAVEWAKQGAKLSPNRVEFPYFHAMGLAMKLQAGAKNALDRLPEVVALARRAIAIDPKFDRAGPLRLLGALYVEAPQVGSIGDPEKGIKLLKKAVDHFPKSPLNRYFLGLGYFKDEQFDKAEEELKFVINAPIKDPWSGRDAKWYRKMARKYLEQIRRKREGGFGV